ncbi:hypothetical protein PIB30_047920, partial [Stylosanthes scabra]|nr:hypothetical protein [Stylosanthes scabra]
PPQSIPHWEPPPPNFQKINCDASFFRHCNRAGFGCVLRDDSGRWKLGRSGNLPIWSIFRYSASVDNDLLHRIRDILHWPWTIQFRLIKREANAIADWLAKRGAMGDADLITWIEPGEYLRSLLKHDITALL